ncbi:MAG: S24 family peptidase [Pseudomonadota bacterium]
MTSVAPRLKALRETAVPSITIRKMADELGVPHSTYAAYEDAKKYKKPILPFDLAKRIAAVLEDRGIARSDVMQLAGLQVHEAEGEARPVVEKLQVKNSVAAGVWREHQEWPSDEWYSLEVGPTPVIGGDRFALRMDGFSMDKTVPPGSDLECLRVAYGTVHPNPGDLVIVARQSHDLVETTCKRLDREPNGEWVLRMESTKPEFQEVLRLGRADRNLFSDDEVRVVGIVLKAHQRHFRRKL